MGLFDIFKKKKPEQVKREETDDFNPLDKLHLDRYAGRARTKRKKDKENDNLI